MKKIWKSKTIWGIVLTVLQMFLKQKGIEVPFLGAENGIILTEAFAAYGMRDAINGGVKV